MPGKAGRQRARVDATFAQRLNELKQDAAAQAAAFQGSGNRAWQVPAETKDLLDVPNLHNPGFDRTALNTNYQQCVQDPNDPGTVGDVIGLKQQIDYNAAEERAFRLRHATITRCFTHAAGRRFGLGAGRVFPNIEKQVSDAIANGGA